MLAQKSLIIVISKLFTYFLSFVALYFIARFLGPEPLGNIGYIVGFLGLFAFLGEFGFGQAHIKRISEGKDLGKGLGTYLFLKIIFAVLSTTVILLVVQFTDIITLDSEEMNVFYILLIGVILRQLSRVSLNTFVAKKETVKQELPSLTAHFFTSISKIIVSVSFLGVVYLAWAYTIGEIVIFLVSLYLIRNYPISKPSFKYFKSYSNFALPLMLVSPIILITASLDKFMVGFFWGYEEVGYLFSIQLITMVLLVVPSSFSALLFPTVSGMNADADKDSLVKLFYKSERYNVLIMLPILTLLFIHADNIILYYLGKDFSPASRILQVTVIYILFRSLTNISGSFLQGLEKQWLVARFALIGIFINIVLNLILIPEEINGYKLFGLGAFGAVIATSSSMIIRFLIGYTYVLIILGIYPNPRISIHFFVSFSLIALFYFISTLYSTTFFYDFLFSLVASLIFYISGLYIMGELTIKDWNFFKKMFNIYKIKNYIYKELGGS